MRGSRTGSHAMAHPCEETALAGAIGAGKKGLITPILVRPAAKIDQLAHSSGISRDNIQIIDTPHSHASAAKEWSWYDCFRPV